MRSMDRDIELRLIFYNYYIFFKGIDFSRCMDYNKGRDIFVKNHHHSTKSFGYTITG